MNTLLETINYACEMHRTQRRKNADKDPYINHPVEVATMISTIGKCDDLVTLQAAILHDVVEDTSATIEDIANKFGNEVADVVMQVTDDKSLSKWERKRIQIELGKTMRHEAKVVRLADKLSNLSSLANNPPTTWSLDVILGYYIWCYEVVKLIRETNEQLENELDIIFNSTVTINNQEYEVIPKDKNEYNSRWNKYVEKLKI